MEITFWGTRGSIAVPGPDTVRYGGNTCCMELKVFGEMRVIVDAGTGIRPLGERLVKDQADKEILLLITHIHWDHLLGFPFFLPAYMPSYRIMVDGYQNCMKGLKFIFQNQMLDGVFPVTFDQLKAKIKYVGLLEKGQAVYKGLKVKTVNLHHPQGGFGFRFEDGESVVSFITDNELGKDAWKGRSFDDYVRFVEGSKLLIHDAQYTPEEYQSRIGWGHSHYNNALDLAVRSGVKRLILFHHDPSRSDKELDNILEIMEPEAKKHGIEVGAAREREVLTA